MGNLKSNLLPWEGIEGNKAILQGVASIHRLFSPVRVRVRVRVRVTGLGLGVRVRVTGLGLGFGLPGKS